MESALTLENLLLLRSLRWEMFANDSRDLLIARAVRVFDGLAVEAGGPHGVDLGGGLESGVHGSGDLFAQPARGIGVEILSEDSRRQILGRDLLGDRLDLQSADDLLGNSNPEHSYFFWYLVCCACIAHVATVLRTYGSMQVKTNGIAITNLN